MTLKHLTTFVFTFLFYNSSYAFNESEFLGFTRSFSEVHISCQVSSYVNKIYFKEGDRVKKNEILIQLDSMDSRLESERKKLIYNSYANLNSAKVKEKILSKQVKSAYRLFSHTGSISRQEYQQKLLEYELAVGERKILEEAKRREKIEYKSAIQLVHKHTIRSTIDGVITNIVLDTGELCDSNSQIATVSDPRKGLFIINVEGFLGENIRKNQKMTISLGENKVRVLGKVIYVAPILDAASGLKEIKIEFDNSKLNILPGVSGTLEMN